MSVLIKDMEMPESCRFCWLGGGYVHPCPAYSGVPSRSRDYYNCMEDGTRPDWCPLVEVQKHGRLIDADALARLFIEAQEQHEKNKKDYCNAFEYGGEICTEWWCVEDMLENAPTVIEAEGET